MLKFNYRVSFLEPRDHVIYEKIPGLEALTVDAFSGVAVIIFVHFAARFDVLSEKGYEGFGESFGVFEIAVIYEGAEAHIVSNEPHGTQPAGWVA